MSAPDDDVQPDMTVSLHGPRPTVEDAAKAGVAMKEILEEIGRSMGVDVKWEIASIQFQCDGCGLKRPDRPRRDEGWSYSDGDDFCPACTAAREDG